MEKPKEFTFPTFRSSHPVQEPFVEQWNPSEEPIREAQPTPYVLEKPKEEMLVEEETNLLASVMFEQELGNAKSNVIMDANETIDEEQTFGPHITINMVENISVNLLHLAMEEYKLQLQKDEQEWNSKNVSCNVLTDDPPIVLQDGENVPIGQQG